MERYQRKIGCFLQIPNVGRGQLKYVGPVDNKPGLYAGVDLLANIGKNDGSFQGIRYFESEYPQSGLFIQLHKVAALIEGTGSTAVSSRRSTMGVDFGSRVTSSGGSSSGSVRRTTMFADPRSPTPMKTKRITSGEDMFGLAPIPAPTPAPAPAPVPVPSATPAPATPATPAVDDTYLQLRQRLEKQDREIAQYKKLLDDQRVILEELHPTIDSYEDNCRNLEETNTRLRAQLSAEIDQQKRQKQYFESEHEQLLAVVDELHQEIKANERRVLNENRSKLETDPTNNNNNNDNNNSLVEQLHKELDDSHKRIFILEGKLDHQQQQQTITASPTIYKDDTASTLESLPIYKPKHKIDVTAGRESWCALCEQGGHDSIDCPYEMAQDEKTKNITSQQLLF